MINILDLTSGLNTPSKKRNYFNFFFHIFIQEQHDNCCKER